MNADDQPSEMTEEEKAFLDRIAPDIALKRRSLRIGRLLEGSSAKVLDIMQAEFGTTRPVGLNLGQIDNPDINIGVIGGRGDSIEEKRPRNKSQWPSGEYDHAWGILISPEFLPVRDPVTNDIFGHKTSTLGHEWLHGLQHTAKKTEGDYLVPLKRFIGPALDIGNARTLKESAVNLARKFNQLALEISTAHEAGGSSLALRHIFGMNNASVGNYYASDAEFQARLHTCMAAGYTDWGKMPVTKVELQAALYNCGAKVSGSTLFTLFATEEGRKARQDFAASATLKNEIYPEIKAMNAVFKYAPSSRAQENLWQYAIPGLYGHMLELYGDKSGRERMGLGTPSHDIRNVMRHIIKADNEGMDESALRAAACTISVDNAAELASNIIYYTEITEKDKSARIVLDEMLKNEELKRAILEPIPYSTYGRLASLTPFEAAVYFNKTEEIKLFLNAGADPFTVAHRFDPVKDTEFTAGVFNLDYIDACKKDPKNHTRMIGGMQCLKDHYTGDRNEQHRVWGNFDGPVQKTKMMSFNEAMEAAGIATALENPRNSAKKPSPGPSL